MRLFLERTASLEARFLLVFLLYNFVAGNVVTPCNLCLEDFFVDVVVSEIP